MTSTPSSGSVSTAGTRACPEARSRPWSLTLPHSAEIRARLRVDGQWGALAEAFVEVDEPAPVVLNEWNAVEPDEVPTGGDAALGAVAGNGGDWLELVVVETTDLRGWRVALTDRRGEAGGFTFLDHPVLAAVPAGTLITIAEDLPEALDFDPTGGDWRFHLRAGADGPAVAVSATPFEVTHREWQLVLYDADGYVRFGPVGE